MESSKEKKPTIFGLEIEKAEILAAILSALLLAALDQTIVSTALPTIVKELGGLNIFSWVFTAYLITSTISVMLVGKLGDMKGRKRIFIYGIVIFIIGSALSGLSRNMPMLIMFRAIQGIGGGAIMTSAMAIIADIFPPAERGKWQGIIGAAFAISSVIGPAAGAIITETVGWPWIFYVNLPIGLIAILLTQRAKHLEQTTHSHKLDIKGTLWFTLFVISLIIYLLSGLALDYLHLAILATSIISLILFLREEYTVPEPILPPSIFSNKIFTVVTIAAFITAITMFGVVAFLPIFVEGVLGGTASVAGSILTAFSLGIVFASTVSGQAISRLDKYKAVGIVGAIFISMGLYMFTSLAITSAYTDLLASTIVLAIGIGITLPLFIVVAQNSLDHSMIGVSTSTIGFFRSLGGVIGVGLMAAIINTQVQTTDFQNVQNAIALYKGLHNAFFASFLVSLTTIPLLFFLKEIPLRRTHGKVSEIEEIALELTEEESVMDEERAKLGNENA